MEPAISLLPKLHLFESSVVVKFCSASTKLSILSRLNSSWHSFIFSGYAWKNSLLDTVKDKSWLDDIGFDFSHPFSLLWETHNSQEIASFLHKFSQF